LQRRWSHWWERSRQPTRRETKLAERMALEKKKNVEVEKKRTKELQNKISDLELELKKAKKDVDKISDLELELKKAKGRGEGDRQA
jgi:hypothetical protein